MKEILSSFLLSPGLYPSFQKVEGDVRDPKEVVIYEECHRCYASSGAPASFCWEMLRCHGKFWCTKFNLQLEMWGIYMIIFFSTESGDNGSWDVLSRYQSERVAVHQQLRSEPTSLSQFGHHWEKYGFVLVGLVIKSFWIELRDTRLDSKVAKERDV